MMESLSRTQDCLSMERLEDTGQFAERQFAERQFAEKHFAGN